MLVSSFFWKSALNHQSAWGRGGVYVGSLSVSTNAQTQRALCWENLDKKNIVPGLLGGGGASHHP